MPDVSRLGQTSTPLRLPLTGHAGDRNDLKAWHNGVRSSTFFSRCCWIYLSEYKDALVQRVAQANTKTIVIVNTVGPIEMELWINNPNG